MDGFQISRKVLAQVCGQTGLAPKELRHIPADALQQLVAEAEAGIVDMDPDSFESAVTEHKRLRGNERARERRKALKLAAAAAQSQP